MRLWLLRVSGREMRRRSWGGVRRTWWHLEMGAQAGGTESPNSSFVLCNFGQVPSPLWASGIIVGRGSGHHPDLRAECEEGAVPELGAQKMVVDLAMWIRLDQSKWRVNC